MLAEQDKQVLKKLLPEMAKIINLVPEDVFECKDADALLILQRRMTESDLKRELVVFNEVFAKQKGASVFDITNSFIAYVKIKVLLDSDIENFEGHSYRALFKECKSQVARTNNIVKLTSTSALTAEDFQKEKMELVLRKNQAFLSALSNLMNSVEKHLERLPKEVEEEPVREEIAEEPVKQIKRKSILDEMSAWLGERSSRKEKEEFLRAEEEKKSKTSTAEISFYDRSLAITEHLVCRGIPEFSILKKKNNVYFGRTRNISSSHYDNQDESLLELTRASEEFIQFMTEDLLSDEYELKIFSDREKAGMQMYFDFMSRCFEKYIGVVLTVREYLDFKSYYNRLVMKMFELEQKQKEDYYRAYALAEKYLSYMRIYCLDCADSREDVIGNIVSEDVINYLADIDMILDNHIVDENARTQLLELHDSMEHFHKTEEEELSADTECTLPKVASEAMPMAQFPAIQAIPQQYIQQNMMQIVVQLLDDKHEVLDEALYAGDNIRQALIDYENKDACIKRLGFRNNGVDVFYKEEVNE